MNQAIQKVNLLADMLIEALLDARPFLENREKPSVAPAPEPLGEISALQRRVLRVIQQSDARPLRAEEIAKRTSSTVSAVKKAIQRMIERGVIEQRAFKRGPQGWSAYKVKEAAV